MSKYIDKTGLIEILTKLKTYIDSKVQKPQVTWIEQTVYGTSSKKLFSGDLQLYQLNANNQFTIYKCSENNKWYYNKSQSLSNLVDGIGVMQWDVYKPTNPSRMQYSYSFYRYFLGEQQDQAFLICNNDPVAFADVNMTTGSVINLDINQGVTMQRMLTLSQEKEFPRTATSNKLFNNPENYGFSNNDPRE